MRKLIIAVDFDNTITVGAGRFPECGKLRIGAKDTINAWIDRGHKVIINICRSSALGADQLCVDYLNYNGIRYTMFNANTKETIDKYGGDTRKISADIYFDDRGMIPDFKAFDAAVSKMERPTIIAIIGESGSGKSLVADYIKETYGIHLVESRTTRKQRNAKDTGHTFVTDAEFDSYDKNDIIAITEFGGKRYCCLHSDINSWANTYVIDEGGLKFLKEKFGDIYDIFSIRILRPYEKRVSDVGKERVDRDEGKFTMKNEEFSAVIANVSDDVDDLFSAVDDVIAKNMLYL